MDREQEELQFIGFFGIFTESTKIIHRWRLIFLKLTSTLILPLSLIFLAHSAVTRRIAGTIQHDEDALDHTRHGTARYSTVSDAVSWEWTQYWLVQAAYLTFFLVLSLLSTSAVVYTIAAAYSGKLDNMITFRKVMTVVPRVWRRLMVTFLWNFAIIFVYNVCAVVVLVFAMVVFYRGTEASAAGVFGVFSLFYFAGFVYISVIWQLASVVSVLEESYGLAAMRKSRELLKGKMSVAVGVFLVVNVLCLGGVKLMFELTVVMGNGNGNVGLGWSGKVGYGVLCLVLLSAVILYGLVVETVLYLVCKSYHHENIDKSTLSDHLEAYLGEYVPLTAKDIQMEPV